MYRQSASMHMSTMKRAVDPILRQAPPFPHPMGGAVTVEYDGSPWQGKVHRVSVDQKTCSIRYDVDGSVEPSVSPSRINQPPPLPPLQPIPEAADVALAEEPAAMEASPVEAVEAAPIEEVQMPMEDPPPFTKKRSVALLNKFFTKLMKARLKRLKHKCKWCCSLRHDMPYVSAEVAKDGNTLELKLVHGTVDMTRGCNLAECGSIKAIDEYLHLQSQLLSEAHRIRDME